MSCQPTFLVIGAQKCGTTSMYYYLRDHPEVFLPGSIKEVSFFTRHYHKGIDYYHSLFHNTHGARARGEVTPNYTSWPTSRVAADRIAAHLPNARLIYMVRNPIRRIPSAYSQHVENGTATYSFNEAVINDPRLVESSRYWARINEYRKYFDDTQIMCVFMEDLANDLEHQLRRCFEFIGVDPSILSDSSQRAWHTRQDMTQDRWRAVEVARRVPLFRALYTTLSVDWKRRVRTLYRRPLAVDTTWNKDTIEYATNMLVDDAKAFLGYCNKPLDFWDLDPSQYMLKSNGS